jgi:hypothetical protein
MPLNAHTRRTKPGFAVVGVAESGEMESVRSDEQRRLDPASIAGEREHE